MILGRGILTAYLVVFSTPLTAGGVTVAHSFTSDDPGAAWAEAFARCLSENVGIYADVLGDGVLGRSNELAVGVNEGLIDFAIVPAWVLSVPGNVGLEDYSDIVRSLENPWIASNTERLAELGADQDVVSTINDELQNSSNMSVIAVGWDFLTLVGSGEALGDLDGRTVKANSLGFQNLMENAGASPVRMAASDVATALARGLTDAAIVSLPYAERVLAEDPSQKAMAIQDFSPFTTPYLMVRSLDGRFSEEISEDILLNCRSAAVDFTQSNIEKYNAFAELFGPDQAMGADFDLKAYWQTEVEDSYQIDVRNAEFNEGVLGALQR